MLLFSQIFKKPLKNMMGAHYRISGSWDQPVVERVTTESENAEGARNARAPGRSSRSRRITGDEIAAVQLCSGPDVRLNLRNASRWLDEAESHGARLVVLPENFAFPRAQRRGAARRIGGAGRRSDTAFLSERARARGMWIVGGTLPMSVPDGKRVRAACLLYDDNGKVAARYDKMHLFDVSLPERNEHYRESSGTEPGAEMCVAATPFGRLGLAVCYDVRFP
jgi:nitrilase